MLIERGRWDLDPQENRWAASDTEVLERGDPDGPGRRRWTAVAGVVVLVGAAGWWFHGTPHRAVAGPPAASGVIAPLIPPAQDLTLSESTPYYRVDPNSHRVLVYVLVANDGEGPISLTTVHVSDANLRLDAVVVPLGTASRLLMSGQPLPEAIFHPASAATAIRLRKGALAALLVSASPDCSTLPTTPTAVLDIVGTVDGAGTPTAASYAVLDAPNGLAPGWLPVALQDACHAVPEAAATTMVRRTVDALILTTIGPSRPPANQMFTVTVTATNTATTPFRGQLGVMATNRTRSNNLPGFVGPDPLDTRPHLSAWAFGGLEHDGVTEVGSGAFLGEQSIQPGATTTVVFYLDASAVSGLALLGPTRGWTPLARPAGAANPLPPTSQPDPVIVLPK